MHYDFSISDTECTAHLIAHLSAQHSIHLVEATTDDIYSALSKFHGKVHTTPKEVFEEALRQAREDSNG